MTRTRRAVLAVGMAVAAVAVGATPASAAPAAHVKTYDRFEFVKGPGGGLLLDFGYTPATVKVPHGSTVRWSNPSTFGEPHTVTVMSKAAVPDTIDEMFACFSEPDAFCNRVLSKHLPESGPPVTVVNAGRRGLDRHGDSRLLLPPEPGGPATTLYAGITAPAGSTLHYICVFHPWMQAKVIVT